MYIYIVWQSSTLMEYISRSRPCFGKNIVVYGSNSI